MDPANNQAFRSFSSVSQQSLSSSSTNVSRVASGPIVMNLSMNKMSLAEDHMYYKCKVLLHRLSSIVDLRPYITAAHAAAEKCAEQQALALSQLLQQTDGANGTFRTSVGSLGFSIYLDHSSGSHTTANAMSANTFTFTAGVLPANLSVDPATQLWKLFQRGTPLCILFNHIRPEAPIATQDGDDLRMCKKAVYDFVVAVKTNLLVEDEAMFTISNVFSDNTHDLLRIVLVISLLLDQFKLAPYDKETEELTAQYAEIKITDERSKVFNELIQTERKYISDLELLLDYRNELRNADALSSEQLHILFPNLSDIVDFHRRLLAGLECNINVPTKYQRIGSIFVHASNGPFAAYEPWTIGQINAIDLINRESANLKKASSLIDPGFELQSFIIKPIQRLCKYPLLLKELIKTYTDSSDATYYNELLMANAAMKEVANQVNEAQRRAENVGFLQNLTERVKNWRGFNLKEQGELLYHSVVSIKDGENVKEYVAYLFERIIFFFVETPPVDSKHKEKTKRDIFSSRKKSHSNVSGSTANLIESLNGGKDLSILELKGRVYISEIYNIASGNLLGYTLVISWSGRKESGSFTLKYRTEETRNQWENCLRYLKSTEMNNQIHRRIRDLRGSYGAETSYDGQFHQNGSHGNFEPTSNRSSHDSFKRHISSSSTYSMMKIGRNGEPVGKIVEPPAIPIGIEVHYKNIKVDAMMLVASTLSFLELRGRVWDHIVANCEVSGSDHITKLKYKDEEGDFVVMDSLDDWQVAVEMTEELAELNNGDMSLAIWAS